MTALAEEEGATGYRVVFYYLDDLSQEYVSLTTNAAGKLSSFPAPPTMDGYTFAGWVDFSNHDVVEGQVFTIDTKVHAT